MEQAGAAAAGRAAAGASLQVGPTGGLPPAATPGSFSVSPADLRSFTCKVL